MKKLTVNETWVLCLAMWKWISRRCKKGKVYSFDDTHVRDLKYQWMKNNGYEGITEDCFFCYKAYVGRSYRCNNCPGKNIDYSFRCADDDYEWERMPRLFYAKLKELNKIRLERKTQT